jgi:hypothetical protein
MNEFRLTGWPALAFILIILLGIIDVIERMLEAIF